MTSLEATRGGCCCDQFYSCRLLPQPEQFAGLGDGLCAAVGWVSCWRKSVGVAGVGEDRHEHVAGL